MGFTVLYDNNNLLRSSPKPSTGFLDLRATLQHGRWIEGKDIQEGEGGREGGMVVDPHKNVGGTGSMPEGPIGVGVLGEGAASPSHHR